MAAAMVAPAVIGREEELASLETFSCRCPGRSRGASCCPARGGRIPQMTWPDLASLFQRGRVDCHARLACSRRARGWQYSRRRVARIHRPIGQLGAQVFLLVFEISQGVASWMTCRVTRLPLREPPEANGRSGGVANGIRTRDTQIHNLVL